MSYPDNNPKTAVGAKKVPLHLVPPSATHYLALAFADGAKKYGPYNWRDNNVSTSVYYGAAKRHLDAFWDGEDLSKDAQVHHLAHVMACCAIVLDALTVGMLNDDRPTEGAAGKLQAEFAASHARVEVAEPVHIVTSLTATETLDRARDAELNYELAQKLWLDVERTQHAPLFVPGHNGEWIGKEETRRTLGDLINEVVAKEQADQQRRWEEDRKRQAVHEARRGLYARHGVPFGEGEESKAEQESSVPGLSGLVGSEVLQFPSQWPESEVDPLASEIFGTSRD